MAKNLKKFVNPRFLKTVDLALLRRLFERHHTQLQGLEFDLLDRDPTERDRRSSIFSPGRNRTIHGDWWRTYIALPRLARAPAWTSCWSAPER